MNEVIDINGRAVERVMYQDQPVIPLRMVDEVHERPSGTAGRNFRQHKKHLILGEDFFLLSVDEWQKLLGTVRRNSSNGRGHAGDMIFLTETGYLMLVKSFTDDLAWQVQRQLVNRYFSLPPAEPEGVNIRHHRGTAAPGGLDIRYTLDLTKLCIKPTRQGVMLLSRLTGIDLDDIAEEIDLAAEASGLVSPTVARFAREHLTEDPDASIPIDDLYAAYTDFCTAAKERPLVRSKLCRELRQVFPAIRRVRLSQGGRPWVYEGVRIGEGL